MSIKVANWHRSEAWFPCHRKQVVNHAIQVPRQVSVYRELASHHL